jgi:hypothetical protein
MMIDLLNKLVDWSKANPKRVIVRMAQISGKQPDSSYRYFLLIDRQNLFSRIFHILAHLCG